MKNYLKTDIPNVVYSSISGSHIYELNNVDSDVDVRHIFVGSSDFYLGLSSDNTGVHVKNENEDSVTCELRKFIGLCVKCNPNWLELLFTDSDKMSVIHEGMNQFYKNNIFLTQNLYNPFVGYATAQFTRITGETKGKLGEKRKNLIELYGYDVKYAMHAIRLLDTFMSICDTGQYSLVSLNNKKLFKDIRMGKYSFENYQIIYDSFLATAKWKWDHVKNDFPPEPDYKYINKVLKEIILSYIN